VSYRCPGQSARDLSAGYHPCPGCGRLVEIFSDEAEAACPHCKRRVFKAAAPSCVRWCKAARECIGPERYMIEMQAAAQEKKKAGEKG